MSEPKKYVISLTQVEGVPAEVVGDRALLLGEVDKLGIPIPTTFVVTSQAFDDFIVATDLVGYISERINNVDYTKHRQIKQNAREIREAILNAPMPDIIGVPIIKAYSGMGGMFEPFVSIGTSPPRPELNEVNYAERVLIDNVKGIENIFSAIKQAWAELFSEGALIFRASISYEGAITMAVTVQRLIQAEVAGVINTKSDATGVDTQMEIQAVLGLYEGVDQLQLTPESYFYNYKEEEIADKKLVPQKTMLVRKGRADMSSPVTEVPISKNWQEKQKLDDRFVINLGRVGASLRSLYGSDLTIQFAYEAGRIYIVTILTEEETSMKRTALEIVKEDARPIEELYPERPDLKEGPSEANLARISGHQVEEEEKRELANLAVIVDEEEKEEKQNLIAKVDVEEEEKEKVQIARPEKVKREEKVKVEIAREAPKKKEEKPKIELATGPVEQKKPKKQEGVEVHGSEVVVDVKPIKTLEKLLTGVGFGQKVQFGLVHFILEDQDWLGLTGDEILVLKKLGNNRIDDVNKVRALVLEEPLKEEQLQHIEVPVVHAVKDAKEILRENEVITIDPKGGEVLLGAGKHPDEEMPAKKQEEIPVVDPFPAVSDKDVIFEEDDERDPVQSGSTFWQLLETAKPAIDAVHSDGLIIDMNDYYRIASLNPEFLLGEPQRKRSFIDQVVAHIKPLLELFDNKSVLLKASDLDYEELSKLQGNQSINFNTRFLKGAAKFAANPKLLEMELEIMAILRNRESLRNLWLAIPNINSAQELAEVKKTISSFGFRRSSTFKLYGFITAPLGMLQVQSIVEHEIDGLALDLDMMLDNLFGEANYELSDEVATFFAWAIKQINSKKSKPMIINARHDVSKEVLQKMIEKGLTQFAVPKKDIYQAKLLVSTIELEKVQKKKKRGRKPKDIDYGF